MSTRPRKSYLDAKHAPDRRPQGHQLVRDITDGELEDWDAYGIEYKTVAERRDRWHSMLAEMGITFIDAEGNPLSGPALDRAYAATVAMLG
jgi:hypothetical protein